MKTFQFLKNRGAFLGRGVPRGERSIRAACVVLALLLSASAAFADSVRLVKYGDVYTGNYDTGFNLSGTNFSFMVSHWLDPLVDCGPCTPGAAFDLSGSFAVRNWESGMATIDGHTYDSVFFDGSFTFDAVPVIVPAMSAGQSGPDGEGTSKLLSTFSFNGTLAGFPDPALAGAPLFSTALTGAGVVAVKFTNYPAGLGIRVLQLDYHFSDAAAPVPEPGTLLLFGSGASWMAARWRMRQRGSAK